VHTSVVLPERVISGFTALAYVVASVLTRLVGATSGAVPPEAAASPPLRTSTTCYVAHRVKARSGVQRGRRAAVITACR
jgi:hypothetical protein